ncbi:MAG: hypothetical protein M5U08_10250 [Burkholderiales bacterium]|nr:hypothetical protein [Burkholderiales bacterium]
MGADVGAGRGPEAAALVHARSRFRVERTAASAVAIDRRYICPDEAGVVCDTPPARRMG